MTAKTAKKGETQLTCDTERWTAVVRRDHARDETFVYSVATTGVYCRPSCPSRAAKRSNVAFHDTPALAEAAGFRACKRCKPNASSHEETIAARIAAACRSIETADAPPTLAELAAASGLSPFHFHRVFKAATGVTPKAYGSATRHKRVSENLKRTASVTEAIHGSGFNASGQFYAKSNAILGMTPTAYRQGGSGTKLTFATGTCSLGAILVAATAKGVAAILLGDDAEALVDDLKKRFPNAALNGGDVAFDAVVATVVNFVDAPRTRLELPLDIRGTAFQHRVWQELRQIPVGATASYADIAKRIGKPGAMRAVAGACAANAIAVAIPCHRVVRGDGALSGYRWGVDRKRKLLKRESDG